MQVKQYFHDQSIDYTGDQLHSHFALETFGIQGDSVVCFRGGCSVEGDRLVDLEDRLSGATIEAADMLHFVVEHFGLNLDGIVLRQRILVALAGEKVYDFLSRNYSETSLCDVRRQGDDIYVLGRKATVSIASVSPVSGMIHLGVNVNPAGAPVEAWGLEEGGIDPDEFALELLSSYVSEMEGIAFAASKVRPL